MKTNSTVQEDNQPAPKSPNRWWKKWWQKRPSFVLKNAAVSIQNWASALLKLGTFALVIVALFWLYRAIQNEGYVIEPFHVPKHLLEGGYDGVVVARKIQDEVLFLKEEANSSKTDSLQLLGNETEDLEIAVLSIGISLRSLTQRVRELFGRKNYFVRGEITYLKDTYNLTLRMTNYAPLVYKVRVKNGNQEEAVQQLLRFCGEGVLLNTDPYRLALICYKTKRYEDAMKAIRHILKHRPSETHWAYLAWGQILAKQGNEEGAIAKYEKTTQLQPDFELAWVRLAWAYIREQQAEKAFSAMYKVLELAPNNVERYHQAAWMFHGQERYEEADKMFKKVTELTPNSPFAWMTWADSKFSRNEVKEAITLIEKSKPYIGENSEGELITAFSRLIQKDTVGALQSLNNSFQLDPTHSAAASNLMSFHYQRQNYNEIIKIGHQTDWQNMKEDLQQKQRALNYWSMAHNEKGQHDLAKKIILDCIELNNKYSTPYTTLAETFAYQEQADSFYYYLEIAFEKGFYPKGLQPYVSPYDRFEKEARFLKLIEQYRREEPVKG